MSRNYIESASRSPPGLLQLVALLESFIRMEPLFESMFMALGYLLGSHLTTWGVLGTLFEVIIAPSGHFWNTLGTFVVLQNEMGRQRCPKRHHHQNSLTLLGTFLGPKIIKSRFQRHPKTSSEICPEKVFLKGVILRSSTCLNCVRGLKNQGFDVFRKGPKNEPNRHPFWHHFWVKYDQKWTRKGFQKIL